jgi:hypothetical protein
MLILQDSPSCMNRELSAGEVAMGSIYEILGANDEDGISITCQHEEGEMVMLRAN